MNEDVAEMVRGGGVRRVYTCKKKYFDSGIPRMIIGRGLYIYSCSPSIKKKDFERN
jgi:hypothetical protein